ncbi:acid protease, partial [Thozetella sp. PMI_491]
QYISSLSIDGETLQVVVDSGSSDTWVIGKNFTCVDYDGSPLSKEYCSFGPAFKGDFKNKTLPRQKFSTRYGDGESVQGDFDLRDVTIAGITVKNQQIGLVSKVYSGGDGTTSGLMGLAYPLLTDIFSAGIGETTLGNKNQHEYDPIFTSMYKQKLVPPLFSMSMDKNNSGWLTFGGLPPVDHAAEFASTPIKMAEVYNVSSLRTEYSFYTIIADGYIYGNQNTTNLTIPASKWTNLFSIDAKVGQFPAIVDSGSTVMSLPTALSDAYAAQFKPAAVVNALTAEYWAPCTAKVPRFGVVIGGQTFFIAEADLLRQSSKLDWNGDGVMYCRLGVKDGYSGPFVLGDSFMNNVVSVFDVGASMMRFARR